MTIISSRQDVPNSSVSSHLPAIGYKVLSAAVLAVMFALIKKLGGEYPVGQIVFVRSFFALLPILWLVRRLGGYRLLRTERPGAHLRRSVAGLCSLFLSFTAVGMLPLATATALGYAAPLFITLFAIPLLGESIRLHRLVAVVFGFGGVLLMAHPDGRGALLGSPVRAGRCGGYGPCIDLHPQDAGHRDEHGHCFLLFAVGHIGECSDTAVLCSLAERD
ncbi:DMT family transporter [Bradyrhizobium sp. SZCCHNRI20481]|uniref:DMT family transporter n=1 Tax=Bradyrhizobium sp. SZCCHNRI20481 TaxID=3057286 RepID=UPI002916FF1F|nr:DMT family transporter [Bradyrhizobium sp. SZCCHNRI20481]